MALHCCGSVIFQRGNDVDSRLWKFCFYIPIEYFRKTIKHQPAGPGGQVRVHFEAFLHAAIGFYTALLAKLCATYGIHDVLVTADKLGFDGCFSRGTPQ